MKLVSTKYCQWKYCPCGKRFTISPKTRNSRNFIFTENGRSHFVFESFALHFLANFEAPNPLGDGLFAFFRPDPPEDL